MSDQNKKQQTNDEVVEHIVATTDPEMVTIPKGFLDEMVDRISHLEASDNSNPNSIVDAIKKAKKESKNSLVRVKFLDGVLVTGYGQSWEVRDPLDPNKYVQKLNVETADGEVHEVDHKNFMETAESEIVEVISKKVEEEDVVVETTTQKDVDFSNFRTVDTGIEVPVIVTYKHTLYTVKVRGKNVTLKESAIN